MYVQCTYKYNIYDICLCVSNNYLEIIIKFTKIYLYTVFLTYKPITNIITNYIY